MEIEDTVDDHNGSIDDGEVAVESIIGVADQSVGHVHFHGTVPTDGLNRH